MTGLTTHVLDLARGKPADGVAVRLYGGGSLLARAETNADGRCDGPLVHALDAGRYRLEFDVGDYFRRQGMVLPDPAFIDTAVIEFGVADEGAHYHVPLLVSPYGYSTYRGS